MCSHSALDMGFSFFVVGVTRSPLEGAKSIIYAAMAPDIKGISGIYFKDCKSGYTTRVSR